MILRGIVLPGTDGVRAWCRVVEFAEEFSISIGFDPLRLGERRGGWGCSGVLSSESRAIAVSGADSNDRFHRADEDLAVTDFTGTGGIGD